jgi:hypothetical protein
MSADEVSETEKKDLALFEILQTDLWRVPLLMPFFSKVTVVRRELIRELYLKNIEKDEKEHRRIDAILWLLDIVYRKICEAMNLQKKALIVSDDTELKKFVKNEEFFNRMEIEELIRMFSEKSEDEK